MKISCGFIGSAACLAVVLAVSTPTSQAQNLLVNPDFESGLTGWTAFGNAYSDAGHAQSGTYGLKLYGNWWSTWDATGVSQNIAVSQGQMLTLQGYGFDPSGDAVTGGNQNFALLKIVWQDSTGAALQPLAGTGAVFGANPGIESQHLDNTTPLDTWELLTASGIAPAGTVTAQIFGGLFIQPNWEGGSLWFDNESAMVTTVPEPSSPALLGLGALSMLIGR